MESYIEVDGSKGNAIKAAGAIVTMSPEEFMKVLNRIESPFIIVTIGGVFKKNYQYLIGYKGLVFFTKSPEKLPLPTDSELIMADYIWVPDV